MCLHGLLIACYGLFIDAWQMGKPEGSHKSPEVVQVSKVGARAFLYTPYSGECHKECDCEDSLPLAGLHAS